MNFFIKEWANKTATLMLGDGTVVWTFTSVEEARKVCSEWYQRQGSGESEYRCYTTQDPSCTSLAIG
jgi:hypothetical protein